MALHLPSLSELRNTEFEIFKFQTRVVVLQALVLLCFALLGMRLFYLQVIRHDELLEQAENNRTAILPTVPNRGTILDRNGVVLSEIIDISLRDKKRFKRLREESKNFDSLPIRSRLTDEEVAKFTAQHFRFPGVEIKARLFRNYPYGHLASHVVGYIGRINQKEKEQLEESDDEANYRGTQYIGKLGVEQRYERELHGITGVQEAHLRPQFICRRNRQ